MRMRFVASTVLVLLAGCASRTQSNGGLEDSLLSEIAKIKVIDNHGHPLKVVGEGEKPDEEYDALTFEEMEPAPPPLRIRDDNPEYITAWKLFYGYLHNDMSTAHVKNLMARKQKVMREKGAAYPAWILDQLGIETLLANRVAMGKGLDAPRFRWVSYVDALMLPFPDEAAKDENPDYRSFYRAQERLQTRYRDESGVKALPATLEEYEKQIVTATLERQKRQGVVAVKFEAAYLRALDFARVDRAPAAAVYARIARGGEWQPGEYKLLQDHLFRFISTEAGRLKLPVHIHACGGAGGYYKLGGTNPAHLDGVFSDPALRKTMFVLVHGGWPYTKETAFLIGKPNVYVDMSALVFVLYPRQVSRILRDWLEMVPEHVLYGGDVEPFMPQINWEETAWLTATTGRKALSMALAGMIEDGVVTREKALRMARGVMRGNAASLYGFPDNP